MSALPIQAETIAAHRQQRIVTLASMLCIIPLGMATKLYDGPCSAWMRASLGGLFYELFWCLFTALWTRRIHPARIAAGVFAITCALEFLQLWHPPFLEAVRANTLGRAMIGDVFDWGDFPYYAIGSTAGWAWLEAIRRRSIKAMVPRDDPART